MRTDGPGPSTGKQPPPASTADQQPAQGGVGGGGFWQGVLFLFESLCDSAALFRSNFPVVFFCCTYHSKQPSRLAAVGVFFYFYFYIDIVNAGGRSKKQKYLLVLLRCRRIHAREAIASNHQRFWKMFGKGTDFYVHSSAG